MKTLSTQNELNLVLVGGQVRLWEKLVTVRVSVTLTAIIFHTACESQCDSATATFPLAQQRFLLQHLHRQRQRRSMRVRARLRRRVSQTWSGQCFRGMLRLSVCLHQGCHRAKEFRCGSDEGKGNWVKTQTPR